MNQNALLKKNTLIAYALCLLTLTEMIDLSIIAVALPQIMGAVSANIEEIAAITTSYVMMVVIFTPVTGVFIKKFGLKKLTVFATIIFGVSSTLCGLSTTLQQLVLFRILQGIGGAFFTPITQTYIDKNFDQDNKQKMNTVYSCCVVVGPVLGPTLGGILTTHLSWRWCFFVNIPLCIISLFLIVIYMTKQKTERVKIDYISFIFMALGLGCLEYGLERGSYYGWFDSSVIVITFACTLLFLGLFIWRGILGKTVINFRLFSQKNFVLICLISFIVTLFFVSVIAYIPTMLQTVYGYPVETAAYLSIPLGLSAMLVAPLILQLSKTVDLRIIAFFGISLLSLVSFLSSTVSLSITFTFIISVGSLEGVGIMCIFIPLMNVLFYKIPKDLEEDASGFFNLVRLLANSFAASFAASIIARSQQISFHDLISHISPYARGYQIWEQKLQVLPQTMKAVIAQEIILGQSYLIGFLDLYYLCGIGMLLITWTVFLIKAPKPSGNVTAPLI
jgi:DHA2 family multidrug resistance protein